MNKVLTFVFVFSCINSVSAQEREKPFERKGFTFGFSTGAGALTLSVNDSTQTRFAVSLPNLKAGYVINKKLALQILLPGSTYKYNHKSRGFEGVVVTGQYWLKDRWWVMAGAGLTLDAPAFWTIKEFREADFNTGFPALTFATGYEFWRKGNFALDIQYRIYAGQANLPDGGRRQGVSNTFNLGFNWY